MVTWQWLKKTWFCFFFFSFFFFLHEQLYIKGTLVVKKSPNISVPHLILSVFHGSSILARCGAQERGEKHTPLWFQSKEEKNLMHTPQTFYLFIFFWKIFLITTLYIGKVARGNSSLKMQGERNLSSECCQTWQDAEEWCICLMYLQRNENTITFTSVLGPFRLAQMLPGLLVIQLVQTYLITAASASIYWWMGLWLFAGGCCVEVCE